MPVADDEEAHAEPAQRSEEAGEAQSPRAGRRMPQALPEA